jgi:hypothetical protein
LVWRIYKDRAILRIVPALLKKSSAQTIFTVLMILMAALGTTGAGIYVDGYGLHPPKQYTGICAPPAFINRDGCFVTVTSVVTVNGQPQTKTTTIPAGHVIIPNSTALSGG